MSNRPVHFEIHASDPDRSIAFYRDIIGLEFAHRVPDRNVAFLWVGTPGRAMLGLVPLPLQVVMSP